MHYRQYQIMLKKFINFITFVDLPIKKKFMLFSFGVMFWFMVMYGVSITTDLSINKITEETLINLINIDKTNHVIIRKLQGLSIDASELINAPDKTAFESKIKISRSRIKDINTFITALSRGEEIIDIDRSTEKLIETIYIVPSNELLGTNTYFTRMEKAVTDINLKLTEISRVLGPSKNSPPEKIIFEYKDLINTASTIASGYSIEITKAYTATIGQINEFNKIAFFIYTGVLFIATGLLVLFTITISNSIATLVKSIVKQIQALGTGKVDLTQKIRIQSKDEIGNLSEEFNNLTKEIYDMVTFKKVIEEDDSLEDVYSRLGHAFSDKFGLDEYIIYEVSNSKNTMNPVYPVILNNKEIFCNEEILQNSVLCKVQKTGHMISSIAFSDICKHFRSDINKDHVCIPMTISGKTGGVVQFLFDKHTAGEDRKDKRLFKAEQYIKESLSVIESKRLTNTLRESALKDSLTDLYNRRFLQEYTETLVAGVLRRKKTVGLIMCDLDFFKQVNDTHGHTVGDAVLKETAVIIKRTVRSSDLVIRFGGEEFLVLIMDTNEGESIKLAEKIRKALEETKIKIPDGTINKTISLGVSEFPKDTESFWQAIKFADVALYKAKGTGRNKSVRFTEEMWEENGF